MAITPQIDIITFILETLLKIDPFTLSKYYTVQDQLLYLILIPHVLIILFLVIFSEKLSFGNKGLRNLIGIAGYIFLIFGGWYGSYLVPILILWWQVALIIALVYFIAGKYFHPVRAGEAMRTGKIIGQKGYLKSQQKKIIRKQIKQTDAQIRTLQNQLNSTGLPDGERAQIRSTIRQLQQHRADLEAQLH